MNETQIAIIGLVAVIVITIIGYYLYQENKFKKMVEKNFNQSTNDVLEQDQGVVFENQATNQKSSFQSSERSVEAIQVETNVELLATTNLDPLLDGPIEINNPQNDSLFAKYEERKFPYADKISAEFDHVIDIYFAKPVKIKALPEIAQFTNKTLQIYILEKNLGWSLYERAKKYQADGIKVISNIIDSDGLATSLQLNNLYNELSNFASRNNGIIRQNDLELELRRIQQQLKHVFEIRDENGKPLNESSNYQVLSIFAKLHHHENPLDVINEIFDFAENYMQYFESRMLSTNRMLMTEKEFSALDKQVKNYINQCNRKGLSLGSEIILRVLP